MGRIYGVLEGDRCNTTIKIQNVGGATFSQTFTTSGGAYETSPADMKNCIAPCPGEYVVTPTPIPGYTISPASRTVYMKECCDNQVSYSANFKCVKISRKGRIELTVTGNCNPGATVTIKNSTTGVVVASGTTDTNGHYVTSSSMENCVIDCPGSHIVTVSKTGCEVSPSQTVTFSERTCCDNGYTAKLEFKCSCGPKPGQIVVSVLGDYSGTTISISSSGGKQVASGTVDGKGNFITGCKLNCGENYIVTATPNRGCKIDQSNQQVTIKRCCPDGFEQVQFTVTCGKRLQNENPQPIPQSQEIQYTDKIFYLANDIEALRIIPI